MDVLTDVLNSIRMRGEVICRFELTAPWGISIPAVEGATFHVVDRGSCWLRLGDEDRLVPLAGGDLVLFPKGVEHQIVDAAPSLSPPLEEVLCNREPDSLLLRHGGGGTPTTVICGVFHLQDGGDHALFSLLPSLIHIKGEQGRAVEWLDTTLKFMSSEIGAARPGSDTIVGRLTDILFIQSVRAWIDSQGNGGCGWLTALNDPQIGAALGQIHRVPGQPWSVEALADRVGMSRSAFSARFSSLLGEPPIRYVTRWRMRLASNWLRDTDISLTAISERLGYDSDGSFERAFKREVGVAPGAYRRRVRTKARGAEAFSTQRAA